MQCHHLVTQVHPDERTLEYREGKEKVVAEILTHLRKECHAQLFNLRKGLREFGEDGVEGAKKELSQMHLRKGFRSVAVAELTHQEQLRAQEDLMLLTRKQSGECKGRLVYNGKGTREWISREDKSSPTVLTESLMMTCAIDAFKGRDVMTLDIPNAYIQASANQRGRGKNHYESKRKVS